MPIRLVEKSSENAKPCAPVLDGTGFGIGRAGSYFATRNQPSSSHSIGSSSVWRPRL